MKLAFVYGLWSSANHRFDFDNIWNHSRGLTGSEVSCFSIAREMARMGHDVTLFTGLVPKCDREWEGVKLQSIEDMIKVVDDTNWHAIYSWNEPDVLRGIGHKLIRMVNLQINSFTHCQPNFDDFVDIWTSPSDSHRNMVGIKAPHFCKWVVVPNGCDPGVYIEGEKVSGRVIYASSPDRGLHWLLQAWPDIKRRVPHASLRIFYRLQEWVDKFINEPLYPNSCPTYPELISRAHYINDALKRFSKRKDLDVKIVDSVSRKQIAYEMSCAEVLAYPCDTVSYTEGFSATILESCAAGIIPVITDKDALGEIYRGSVPMVKHPVSDRLDEFATGVIVSLTEPRFRISMLEKSRALADNYTWPKIARSVESIIMQARKDRGWPC